MHTRLYSSSNITSSFTKDTRKEALAKLFFETPGGVLGFIWGGILVSPSSSFLVLVPSSGATIAERIELKLSLKIGLKKLVTDSFK